MKHEKKNMLSFLKKPDVQIVFKYVHDWGNLKVVFVNVHVKK